MPRTKQPPETLALSEVPLKEKHELGAGHEDDCGNDTLVNRGTDQTEDVATERRNKDDDASGSDSPTGSSDEFDWDEEDGASTTVRNGHVVKAKRGRAVYLAFMKLARPLRVTLLCIVVGGILIAPLLIVHFVFRSNPVKKHVFAWSIWLTTVWVAGCLTYVVVDASEWALLALVSLFGGKTESLQMQLEVRSFFTLAFAWVWCLSVSGYFSTVDDCSLRMGQACFGHRLGVDFSLDHAERLQTSWYILGLRQPGNAGNAAFQLDDIYIADRSTRRDTIS